MNRTKPRYVLHFNSSNIFNEDFIHIFCTASAFISSKIDSSQKYYLLDEFIDNEVIKYTDQLLRNNDENITKSLYTVLDNVSLEYIKLNSPIYLAKYKLFSVLSRLKFKYEVYRSDYTKIKNYDDLVDYINLFTENYPHISLNSNLFCIFINKINILLLRFHFLLRRSKKSFLIFTAIKPWLSDLAQLKLKEKKEILQILYVPTKITLINTIFRLFNTFRSLFLGKKVLYLCPEESKNKDFQNQIFKTLKSLDIGYKYSGNLVRLALISEKMRIRINNILNFSFFKKADIQVVLAELQSPVSLSLPFLKTNHIHMISHGSLSSYSTSFSNELLVRTIGANKYTPHNYYQSKNTYDLFKKLKICSKPLKPTAIRILTTLKKRYYKNKSTLTILHASTYKPFRSSRPGLFPTSTEYLSSIHDLLNVSKNYSDIKIIISFRDLGELTLNELKSYINENHFNCEINPKGKLFDELLSGSDIIFSHTSTCMEKALQISKPIICKNVKGFDHYFSQSIIDKYALPVKLVNSINDIKIAINYLRNNDPNIKANYFPSNSLGI